jgi:hypothetical protein
MRIVNRLGSPTIHEREDVAIQKWQLYVQLPSQNSPEVLVVA